jgi:hypothetical protein
MKKIILVIALLIVSLVSNAQQLNPLTLLMSRAEGKVQLNKLALDHCLTQIEDMDNGVKINTKDLYWHKISDNGDNIIFQDNYLSIKYDFNYEDIIYKITLSFKEVPMAIEKFSELLQGFKLYDKVHRVYLYRGETEEDDIFVRIVQPNRICITGYYEISSQVK